MINVDYRETAATQEEENVRTVIKIILVGYVIRENISKANRYILHQKRVSAGRSSTLCRLSFIFILLLDFCNFHQPYIYSIYNS